MAKRQFDLSAMMETVSNLNTNPGPQVKMLPLDDILDNKANFYKVDKAALKPLADSIAMDGLQQYLVVMPHPKQEGKYLLLSGHRRCAAIRMLVEDKDSPREDLRLVPCTVRQYQSEAMAELQLILANSTARTLTNAEISKQAERMEMPDMKPILFNTDMVCAILDGRKTVTRRVVKPQPKWQLWPTLPESCWPGYFAEEATLRVVKPPYRPVDILYVREAFQQNYDGSYSYRAGHKFEKCVGWRPSIHMPREAARIFLRVTDVRVERLRDISDTDCMAEGVTCPWNVDLPDAFHEVWDSTIKKSDRALYGWDANPWVWVIEFERISREEAVNHAVL